MRLSPPDGFWRKTLLPAEPPSRLPADSPSKLELPAARASSDAAAESLVGDCGGVGSSESRLGGKTLRLSTARCRLISFAGRGGLNVPDWVTKSEAHRSLGGGGGSSKSERHNEWNVSSKGKSCARNNEKAYRCTRSGTPNSIPTICEDCESSQRSSSPREEHLRRSLRLGELGRRTGAVEFVLWRPRTFDRRGRAWRCVPVVVRVQVGRRCDVALPRRDVGGRC